MRAIKNFFKLASMLTCSLLYAEDGVSVDTVPDDTLSLSKASYYHFANDQNLSELIMNFFKAGNNGGDFSKNKLHCKWQA
jgi:hypothetical protein